MLLVKDEASVDIVPQISGLKVIHEQVEILPILKRTFHINNEITLTLQQMGEYLSLVHYWLHTFFGYDSRFVYYFESKDLFRLLFSDFPNSAEPSFSDNTNEIKHRLIIFVLLLLHSVEDSALPFPQPFPIRALLSKI